MQKLRYGKKIDGKDISRMSKSLMLGSFPSTGCQPAGRATSTSASDTWNGRRRDEDTKSLPTVEASSGRNSSCSKKCLVDGDFGRDFRNQTSYARHDLRPLLPTFEARMARNSSVEETLRFVNSIVDLLATLRHKMTKQ